MYVRYVPIDINMQIDIWMNKSALFTKLFRFDVYLILF